MINLTKSSYQIYSKRYHARQKARLQKEKQIQILKKKIEYYVKTFLQTKYTAEIGLVHNRFEEFLEKYGTFTIYVANGYNVGHKDIKVSEIEKYLEIINL